MRGILLTNWFLHGFIRLGSLANQLYQYTMCVEQWSAINEYLKLSSSYQGPICVVKTVIPSPSLSKKLIRQVTNLDSIMT